MEQLKIRTEQFEGPMDLLLFLIQKNELDISSISLHAITDQYVQYIEYMRELNFDLASEFLVMAATLIHIKSKRLLPQLDDGIQSSSDDDLPTSEEELLRRLKEYQEFQKQGRELLARPLLGQDVFPRPNVAPIERQSVWREIDITELTVAFQEVLHHVRRSTRVIIREPTSIPEKIQELGRILKPGERTEFSSLIPAEPTKSDIVVTFIALLEIARFKKLRLFQNETYGSIYITLTEALTDADSALATGFQYNVKSALENLAPAGNA